MKIIFLDVDGVLNTANLVRILGSSFICDDRVIILKRIVKLTGAKIVLSSDRRKKPEDAELVKRALLKHDLDFIDKTPVLSIRPSMYVFRRQEISNWLTEHEEVLKFAIVDDRIDACVENYESSFFKTDSYDSGLTNEIADAIIEHLNS